MPEQVIQEVSPSSSAEIRLAAKQEYQKLLVAVKLVWKIYDNFLHELLDAVQQYGNEITEGVDAAFCNPLLKTSQNAESGSLKYEWLSLNDMTVFVDVLSTVMNQRLHWCIFCSELQFKTGHELIKRKN